MYLAVYIAIILFIFSVLLAFVWAWFFRNEQKLCLRFYNAGMKALAKGKNKKAAALFKRAMLINPDFEDVKYRLGLVYLGEKSYGQAEEALTTILNSDPKNAKARIALAQSLQAQKAYDSALEQYSKALESDENNFEALNGMGFIKYQKGEHQEALALLEKALALSPDNKNTEFYVNKCNDELCSYEIDCDGADIIGKYLKMDGKDNLPNDFHFSLAQAYAKTGQVEHAQEYCHKALEANPEDVESYKLLGIIHLAKKDFTTAKNMLLTALKLQPNNDEIHDILSYALCYQVDNCPLDRCRERYRELMGNFLK